MIRPKNHVVLRPYQSTRTSHGEPSTRHSSPDRAGRQIESSDERSRINTTVAAERAPYMCPSADREAASLSAQREKGPPRSSSSSPHPSPCPSRPLQYLFAQRPRPRAVTPQSLGFLSHRGGGSGTNTAACGFVSLI